MSLIRSSLIVGLASAGSKILGFARDVLFAQVLGAGPVADAFLAAFRLPNFLRRAVGEGGLNPVLVPVLTGRNPEQESHVVGGLLSGLGLLLLGLTALVELGAGLAVLIVAPGLGDDPETLALGALYTRLAFPLVAGITLASVISAVLNHRRRFAATAWAPLVVNAVLVGTALALLRGSSLPLEHQAAWLAAATSLGGLAHLVIVGVALARTNLPLRLAWPRRPPGLGRLVGTAFATLIASSAAQLFALVGTQVASFLPSGVSWLYYADRLVQLPLGIIASVAGMVLLPELAARHGSGDAQGMMAAQNRALEVAILVALPAAVALALLADPITAVLFERGAFGPEDTRGTADAIIGLGLGLPFAVIGKVLAQTVFVRCATRDALLAVALGLVATSGSALILSSSLGVIGIGLGIALGCLVHVGALAHALRRAGLLALDARLAGRVCRIALASAVLGAGLGVARNLLPPSAGGLAALCLGGLAFYGGLGWLLGAVRREDLALLAKKA